MARVPEGITAEKFFCFYIILFAQKRRGLMSQWTENWCRFLRACQQGATPLVARTASNWFATSVNGFIMTLWSRRWFKVFFSSAWRPFRKRWSLLEGCGRESRMEGRGYLALRVTSGSRKPRWATARELQYYKSQTGPDKFPKIQNTDWICFYVSNLFAHFSILSFLWKCYL